MLDGPGHLEGPTTGTRTGRTLWCARVHGIGPSLGLGPMQGNMTTVAGLGQGPMQGTVATVPGLGPMQGAMTTAGTMTGLGQGTMQGPGQGPMVGAMTGLGQTLFPMAKGQGNTYQARGMGQSQGFIPGIPIAGIGPGLGLAIENQGQGLNPHPVTGIGKAIEHRTGLDQGIETGLAQGHLISGNELLPRPQIGFWHSQSHWRS